MSTWGNAVFWFGLLLCTLLGVEIGGTVAGGLHLVDPGAAGVGLFVVGINLIPWTAIAGFALLFGSGRKAAGIAEVRTMHPALARIESSRAVGEGPDFAVRLDLTVAPDGRPGYRVWSTTTVNLMDMDDFRAGRIVVVDHDPEQPWRVQVRKRPTSEWAARAALAKIDSAPVETMEVEPKKVATARRRRARPGLLAMDVGLLLSVLLFWSEFSSAF